MATTLDFPRPMGVQKAEFERNGYRPLVDDEADDIAYGEFVNVLDTLTGDHLKAKVINVAEGLIEAQTAHGWILRFDTNDEAGEDRRPPIAIEDGRGFVIVTVKPYPAPHTDVFNALKASLAINELRAHNDQIANFVQGLPTREMYDEMLNTVVALRNEVAALRNAMRKTA